MPIAQTGEANGVNALMRVIGTSTSAALVGTILTWSMVTVLGTNGQPTRVPDVAGYLTAAIISLAACVAAALVALVCLANLVLALTSGGSVWESIFWGVGTLIGAFGLLVFYQRGRVQG